MLMYWKRVILAAALSSILDVNSESLFGNNPTSRLSPSYTRSPPTSTERQSVRRTNMASAYTPPACTRYERASAPQPHRSIRIVSTYVEQQNSTMADDTSSNSEPEEIIEYLQTELLIPDDTAVLKEFIAKMESLPELWDPSLPSYMDSNARRKALGQLLTIYRHIRPNATITDVRKKINSLRSNYRKELKKVLNSQLTAESEDDVYKPRSWVYHAMEFIGSVIKAPIAADLCNESAQEDTVTPAKKIKTIATPMVTLIKPKPKYEDDPRVYQRVNTILSEAVASSSKSESKPIDSTVVYWSDKLNSITDPIQRLYAEKYINEVLFLAQLGRLSAIPPLEIVVADESQKNMSVGSTTRVLKEEPC